MYKRLSAASVVALFVVIIMLSVSLLYAGFTYPSGGGGTGHGRLFDLFHRQYYDKNGLGRNGTVFRQTIGRSAYIVGYARSSGSALIINSRLFAAVFPEETDVSTNSTGFYSILVLYRGAGTFAFEIQNYSTIYRNVTLRSGTNWLNLTFIPAALHPVSGTTVSQSGHAVIHASVTFDDFISNTSVFSNSSGDFRTALPDGNYTIIATAQFYGSGIRNITVRGNLLQGIVITLTNGSNASFAVSGKVITTSGLPVGNAYVKCDPFNNIAITNRYGNFTFSGIFGYVTFTTRAIAYLINRTAPFLVKSSIPLMNVTISPVTSVGSGIDLLDARLWNGTSIAFYNYSTLVKRLGAPQTAGYYSTGGSTVNIHFHNMTGNISGEEYLLYVEADGVLYSGTSYYLQVTNSTGWLTIQLYYGGPFTIVVKLPYYRSFVFNGTFTGTTWLNASLKNEHLYNVTVNGTDPYNTSAFIGRPAILNMAVNSTLFFNSTKMANFTTTTFRLPNGTYEFSPNLLKYFAGQEWVDSDITLRVNGGAVSGWLYYKEYMVMIHDNSDFRVFDELRYNSTSYNGSLSGFIQPHMWLNISAINGFAAGDYSYLFSTGNGTYSISGTFRLNSSHPAYAVNFSAQNGSANITSGMAYLTSGGTMKVGFNITVPSGATMELVTGIDIDGLNFTLGSSHLYIGQYTFNFSGNFLNLTTFPALNSTITSQLVFTNLTRWQETDILSMMYLVIHYTVPKFRLNYIYD